MMKPIHSLILRYALIAPLLLLIAACNPQQDDNWLVGQLESDRIEITSEFAEPIVSISVKEGQMVDADTVLLEQNSERVDNRLAEATAHSAQLQARLDELIRGPRKEKILAAQAKLQGIQSERDYRKSELSRLKTLLAQQLVSTDQFDQTQTAFNSADAELLSLKAQLEELLNGSTPEELTQAQQQLAQAQAQLTGITIDLNRHSYIAPVDGIIDSLPFQLGERPQPGQPVVILIPNTQPYARVYIPETKRAQLNIGDKVKVHMDGYGKAIDGRIRFIASDAAFTPYFAITEKDRGKLTFLAKIDLLTTERTMPDGMPVQIELLNSNKSE